MNELLPQILIAAVLAIPLSRMLITIVRGIAPTPAAHTVPMQRQGPCVPYAEAVATDMIEPGIAPLVHVLNQVDGVQTLASCEAHLLRAAPAALIDGLPYVMFRAPIAFVQSMDAWLAGGSSAVPGVTHYRWEVTAHFRPAQDPREAPGSIRAPQSELVWTIRVADARLPDRFERARVDADVRLMAAAVRRIAFLTGHAVRETA